MRKTNILIVIDKLEYHGSSINGPARYYSWLIQALDHMRFNVKFCSLRCKGDSDKIFQNLGIEVLYLGLDKYNPFAFVRIMKIIKKHDIDLLHLTGYASTTFGRIAGFIMKKPTVIHEHWVDPNFSGILAFIEKILGKITARAIAISDYSAKFLVDKKGLDQNKVVLIKNGIPLERFYNVTEEDGRRMREKLGISPKAKIIAMVGMLHDNKGHKYFIKAAQIVKNTFANDKFIIVGEGDLKEKLQQQVEQFSLENYVLFVGQQEDMPAILQLIDVFVICSYTESFSLSLLEAMASGLGIVTTDCGGPSEIIDENDTGYIVPVRNEELLAQRIIKLLKEDDLCSAMGNRAKIMSKQYDIKLTAEKVQNLYEDILRPNQ